MVGMGMIWMSKVLAARAGATAVAKAGSFALLRMSSGLEWEWLLGARI